MRNRIRTRAISAILVMVLLLQVIPVVFAVDDPAVPTESTIPVETTAETTTPEATEPPVEAETTEPVQEPVENGEQE